jgi:hypothetical protein
MRGRDHVGNRHLFRNRQNGRFEPNRYARRAGTCGAIAGELKRGWDAFAAMPHYYFHVFNDDITVDEEGQDLADLDAARAIAIESARDLACASIRHGHLKLDHRIEIADEDNARLMTVTFREAFRIEG